MNRWLTLLALALLTGCSAAPTPAVTAIASGGLAHLDAGTTGGLPEDLAAHPSVQLARPGAYTLTPEAAPFLEALETVVVPQRRRIAERLLRDAEAVSGLAGWTRGSEGARRGLIERVVAIASEAMGCEPPTLEIDTHDPGEPGLFAAYTAKGQAGVITLYLTPLSAGGPELAVSAVVHELRHAAQYQLTQAVPAAPVETPEGVLRQAYAESFDVVAALGGEADLSYGDYVHLNVEYDAFQSGNQVAALISSVAHATAQLGFVDVKFGPGLAPLFDLRAASTTTTGPALFTAVNTAHAQAPRTVITGRRGRERLRVPGAGRRG